ncbi:MAG: hypothetical protein GY950_05525 [bacterium]|nr:hypothetical protein [bacterium]
MAFVLLRLYSISYPKDIEEETDIVYLESFHDYGSMFKLNLRDRQFFLTPLIDDMKVRGKTVSEETDIHNGDLVAIEEHTFQFKVYPGEYEYKEVYHRPLHFILPAPRSVKYIGGFAGLDRRKIVADVKNHDLLKKLIVEISPEVLKELAPVPGAVLEFSRDRKTGRVRLRPLVGDMLRIRDLDEKIIPKNTAVPITGGDIFKVSSFRPGSETALYFKFAYGRYEGSESLSISYRQRQDFPFAFTREPEAAILRSIDSGITYGIDLTKETVFMGKQGLYSFNLDPGELMDKLYIPDKIPQGRVVDLKELLDRDMYYVENKTFVPVTFWFLNTVRKHLKKGKRELREFFEKAGVTWRDFRGYPEFDRYAGKAATLILKMRNKGIYPMYVREIKKLNKKGDRKEELKNIFRVKNNRVYLRQTQAQRPTFQKVKIPQKPVILDKEKRIAAYSSEVNGTSRRFYSSDLPPDLLPIMGSNRDETWGLEQIFSRLYRENRLYDIRLNVNLEWQKIALAAMREMLSANRATELHHRVYLKL